MNMTTEAGSSRKKTTPVGVYAGSFDPIHAGHLAFALAAQQQLSLQRILFVPERQPQQTRSAPEHYAHRCAMIRRALRPHNRLALLELPDRHLNLNSLPRLRRTVKSAEIVLLVGAETLLTHQELPAIYNQLNLVVAVASRAEQRRVQQYLAKAGVSLDTRYISIARPRVSSRLIRHALRRGQWVRGLLPSVRRYAMKRWLYLPLPH